MGKEDSVRTVFVTLLLNLCPGCQTQSQQCKEDGRAQEPGSKAGVVAVYPLCKASLHQRPVYQHHLEKRVSLRILHGIKGLGGSFNLSVSQETGADLGVIVPFGIGV